MATQLTTTDGVDVKASKHQVYAGTRAGLLKGNEQHPLCTMPKSQISICEDKKHTTQNQVNDGITLQGQLGLELGNGEENVRAAGRRTEAIHRGRRRK